MKTRIKILIVIIVSFMAVNYLMVGINTPRDLASKVNSFAFQVQVRYLSKIIPVNSDLIKNKTLESIVKIPIVKASKAQAIKTVNYKGKELKISVDDPSENIPESYLEFFYQLQLQKEEQYKIKSIEIP